MDRNVELVPGAVDNWGRSVKTVDVAPVLLLAGSSGGGGRRWEFTTPVVLSGHHSSTSQEQDGNGRNTQGVTVVAKRRAIEAEGLPQWVADAFEVAAAAASDAGSGASQQGMQSRL